MNKSLYLVECKNKLKKFSFHDWLLSHMYQTDSPTLTKFQIISDPTTDVSTASTEV